MPIEMVGRARRFWRWLRIALAALLATLAASAVVLAYAYFSLSRALPHSIDAVTDYRPMSASSVFSVDHELIGRFFTEKRVLVPIAEVPDLVKKAFVAAEDARFYHHHGVDYLGILRAAWADVRAGQIIQGGSTITQQVAKMLLVGKQRSFSRKAREALLARRIERELSKDQILGIYLNNVFFGHGAYGIAEAARAFFGKEVQELSVAETALLAALPKAPSKISPFHNYARARVRQLHVIDEMQRLRFITPATADTARSEPLVLVSRSRPLVHVAAPYFLETVRQAVLDRYGDSERLRRGLRIETTLDMRLQRSAEAAVRRGLDEWHRGHGFSGPLTRLDSSGVKRLTRGRPRLIGPEGFALDEDQALLLLGESKPTPVPAAAESPHPGAHPREPEPRTCEANQPRGERDGHPRAFETDPEARYAAVITRIGPRLAMRSGALSARLDPADEAHVQAWRGASGERIAVGDVLPVHLHAAAGSQAGHHRELTASLADVPSLQGALLALTPTDGHLLAMVGGYDYRRSQFNRATQAHRQVGSAIKPFVYATALDKGMTELTIQQDAPVRLRTASGIWAPHNYSHRYRGPVTLRTALAESINTVAARVVAKVGVDSVIATMRRLGIASKLPRALSIALGTADLSLQEMSYALASFAVGGRLVSPVFITKVVDADGKVLEEQPATPPEQPQRLDPDTAYIVTDMMKGVVEDGTGRGARDLGRPIAGKTGTATDYRDAWFFGFTPDVLCGVWVGRDDFNPIGYGATGGRVALPIWRSFMRQALKGTPVHNFTPPPGIVFVRADPDRGWPANPGKKHSRLVPFKRGTLPQAFMTQGWVSFSQASF